MATIRRLSSFSTCRQALALFLALLHSLSLAAELPALSLKADYTVVESGAYANAAAANEAWRPMESSAPAALARLRDGREVLKLPCNFKGTKMARAAWDRSIDLDLAACRGIQFRFFCANAAPVSHFSIYLRSGEGWYAATFAPQGSKDWSTVIIDKSATRVEGTPSGWSKIQAIRLSAWRGTDVDTECYLADIGLLGADAPIAIIRGESVARSSPGEAESVARYCQAVAQMLKKLDLPFTIISDLDVTPERLAGKKLLILPHNPSMPDDIAAKLTSTLQGGAKLLVFYALSDRLSPALGIGGGRHLPQKHPGHFATIRFAGDIIKGAPPVVEQRSWNIKQALAIADKSQVAATWYDADGKSTGEAAIVVSANCIQMTHVLLSDDEPNKRRMLLALVGHFMPEVWRQSCQKRIAQIGCFGPFKDLADATRQLQLALEAKAPWHERLKKAAALKEQAAELCRAQKYAESYAAAGEAESLMLSAYCASLKPQAGEHRAFWCHSAFGVQGMSWDAAIKLLADNGFTAIIPNMLWGGSASYNSSVLPMDAQTRAQGDQIAQCLAACRKYGLACHVWKVCFNTGGHAPREFIEKLVREGRTQVHFDGNPEGHWLCPSHPENQRLEIDAMLEIANNYDVDGLHFDYIRYPDANSCFCGGCRERFEALLGEKVKSWPADVRRNDGLRQKWLDFRRANITHVVASVSEAARKARPKIKISAAVFRNWPVDSDGVGQDWKLWCERGYLDFVCPMDYTPENGQFENQVVQQQTWAGKVPCYPGIGVSCWQPAGDICRLIEQIGITRRLKTGGFTVFELSPIEAKQIVPLCGLGITRRVP